MKGHQIRRGQDVRKGERLGAIARSSLAGVAVTTIRWHDDGTETIEDIADLERITIINGGKAVIIRNSLARFEVNGATYESLEEAMQACGS